MPMHETCEPILSKIRNRMKRRNFLGALGTLALFSPTLGQAIADPVAARITGLRMERDRTTMRLAIELTDKVRYQVSTLSSPPRVVVDIDGAAGELPSEDVDLDGSPIADIRIGRRARGIRVVLDMRLAIQPHVYLRQGQPAGPELVVELSATQAEPTAMTEMHPIRPLVVAIDAGHGGKDPGAVSADDHYEKHVAFAIAGKLHRLLGEDPRFKSTLIRNDDYFVPLHERVLIAHRRNADLFMSIHADAAPDRDAQGASVFVLSEHGATSAMARWLAESENSSDKYESLRERALYNKNPVLSKVLVDMSMDATILSSLDLGRTMIDRLGQVTRLHQRQVDQAAFAVLKSPDIPSILVETGFMSNQDDCGRLITDKHQDDLAGSLKSGIEDYFRKHPVSRPA